MQNISAALTYPLILIAGALQALGPLMNGALRKALENPWLASTVPRATGFWTAKCNSSATSR